MMSWDCSVGRALAVCLIPCWIGFALACSALACSALACSALEPNPPETDRRPEQVLSLAGIEPGMTVVDLMAGAGFYTETLARAVGPLGRVLSHNSPLTHERYGRFLDERLDAARLGNIERRVEPIDALTLEPASLDAAFLVLFYHDTYWMGVDRSAMNRAVLNALRPGGVYLVIDHAAEPGSGSRDSKTLHRIDEEMVRAEIQGAGFRLTRSAAFLRNPDDERTRNVFEPGIRGRTDRFVLRFEKP